MQVAKTTRTGAIYCAPAGASDLRATALADWIHRVADQAVTLTDAVSFAVMRAARITTAFTFDQHFRTAGFEVVPG